ncbi:MAG: YdiL family protein [Azoarcus sp.]|jgi:hypothetical protein|nr:YdiL family protein [Azoarcus sp.]
MTNTELEVARRLLFFSQAEAAAMVGGVSEQAWRRWEAGRKPVPDDVEVRLRFLLDYRSRALLAGRAVIEQAPADAELTVIWYGSLDGWASLEGREPVEWRAQQSAVAALAAEYPDRVVFVPFDVRAYHAWLAGRPDGEDMRARWAAEVAGREGEQ